MRLRGFEVFFLALFGVTAMIFGAVLSATLALADGAITQALIGHLLGSTLAVAVILLMLRFVNRVPLHQVGWHCARPISNLGFGVAQLALWWPATALTNLLARDMAPQETIHPVQEFLSEHHGPGEWLIIVVSVVVAAPLVEELAFRGVLQGWLCKSLSAPGAILVASVLFGLVHGSTWPDPIPLTLFGIGLGITYQRTRSLLAPVALHASFNASMLLLGALYGVE